MNADAHLDDALEPGALIGDHFVIRSQLGSGGMGDVYLAEHAALPDIKCAVKVLRRELSANESFVGILRAEARKQSRLEHDNVVQIRDFFEWNGRYCLVQSFVRGETLNRLIAESPRGLELRFALRVICDVLSGLDYAHEQGILHCDIKPSNIIIDESGRARILDFGIARDLGASSGDSDVLSAGTPDYMSPEQILPPFEVDHRTDVYSSGVTLFQMLAGRLPFDHGSGRVDGEMPQVRLDPPDVRRFRPDIPEVVARIIVTATQRDRDRRFAGCADFREAILEYQRRERWRRTWLPAIAASLVIATAVGFALWEWSLHVQQKNVLSASASIGTAAESLNQLCREAEERQRKQAGLALALKMQDEEGQRLVDGFRHQLADIDTNIEGIARNYLGALQQLHTLPAAAVGKARALAFQSPAGEERQWATGMVASDYEALRSGRATPSSSDALIARCRPPATGPAAPRSQQPAHD